MQEYDVALKLLLQGSATLTMRELTGTTVAKWLDVELPKVQNLRLDLLGETADGGLVHVELQSGNDAAMPLRMAEYCLGVFRLFGRLPRQVVLYVGEAQLRMESELRGPDVLFQYRLIDIRTLDGDRLLESDAVGDNVIAILAGLRDHEEAVGKIVKRIAGLAAAERLTTPYFPPAIAEPVVRVMHPATGVRRSPSASRTHARSADSPHWRKRSTAPIP